MGITQLFFRKGNYLASIELDVIVNETTQASSTITSNPVENGADVNDNIIINPMTFTITGVISNSKVSLLGGLNTITSFADNSKPNVDAWGNLLKLQAERKPFDLETTLKTYKNIVIENLSTDQDKDTSNALFFTANLKEIIFVGNKVLKASDYSDSVTADKATPSVNGGLKS
jgi:hypothetical protein